MRLVYDQSELVAKWVALHIPQMADNPDFGPCVAVGVVDDEGLPIGGVVWHSYHPQYKSIEVSCASESPRWLTAPIISEIFRYPFKQLGLNRVQAVTPAEPTSARSFLKKFGFSCDGVIRDGLGPGRNAKVWSLLRSDWDASRFNLDAKAVSSPAPYGCGKLQTGSRRNRPQRLSGTPRNQVDAKSRTPGIR